MYPTVTDLQEESGEIKCHLCKQPIDVGIRFIRFTDHTDTVHKHCEEEMEACIHSGHLHKQE